MGGILPETFEDMAKKPTEGTTESAAVVGTSVAVENTTEAIPAPAQSPAVEPAKEQQ